MILLKEYLEKKRRKKNSYLYVQSVLYVEISYYTIGWEKDISKKKILNFKNLKRIKLCKTYIYCTYVGIQV